MKKQIKWIVLVLALCLALSTLGLVGCNDQQPDETPDAFTVTYVYGNGEENLVRTVNSGDKAVEPKNPTKDGYTFDFWYLSGQNSAYDFDTPVTSDITLNAHWTENKQSPPAVNTYISWNSGSFAEFLIDGESGVIVNSVKEGEEVAFKLRVSPYSVGSPVVTVSGKELTADDGWYTLIAKGSEMLVAVSGLEADTTPITGVGIQRDPYVISTPANFKTFADGVNNAGNSKFNDAYVVLANDLSFNGEELEPIGLVLNSTHFSGTFDGKGHTISDFVMKGKNGLAGLFGYVVTGVVNNVNVANAKYSIDTSENSNYIVGGIVAYNMGSDISGCSYAGDINIDLNTLGLNAYIGGIVGFGQGYSTTNSATVSYCSVYGNIVSNGLASLLSVGGIVGSAVGTSASAPFVVYNCVFNGEIGEKVILGGGIVGYLRDNTAIANCYSAGNIKAINAYGAASVGAFSGLAEQESAITNSYSQISFTASGTTEMSGVIADGLVGSKYLDGNRIVNSYASVDSKEILILNTYFLHDGEVTAKGKYDSAPSIDWTNFAQIKTLLKWNDSEWTFENGAPKAVVAEDYELSYTVTFDFDGKTLPDGTVGSDSGEFGAYIPLHWLYEGDGKNTFKATDNSISFGYFLDEYRTIRMPSSFLLTSDITVYVGFEDYSSVAATYYITDAYGEQAAIEFDDNGMMTMTYDNMVARYMYVYDGEKILIKDAYFAYMFYRPSGSSSLISDFYAEIDNNVLTIYDNYFFCEFNPDSSYDSIKAYLGNAVMGKWYDSAQSTYTFNLDGTGLKVAKNTAETYFSYTIDGKNLVITLDGVVYQAVLSDDGRTIETSQGAVLSLDKFDIFAGNWETSFNNRIEVSFDGMGKLTFEGKDSVYTVDADGVISFAEGHAKIAENGLIVLTYNGNDYTLAREYSYMGTWIDVDLDYTVTFNGIGVNGYGEGFDSQGVTFTYSAEKTSEATASYDGYTISLYYRTTLYGYGNYAVDKDEEEFIWFSVYMENVGALWDYVNLSYLDSVYGSWDTDDGFDFNFNGLGAYDKNEFSDGSQWIIEGEVVITNAEDKVQVARYYFDRATGKATFTYENKAYVVTVDKNGNLTYTIAGGASKPLYARDIYADIALGNESYKITFNGRSASNHGIAVVKTAADAKVYTYTLSGTTVLMYDLDTLVYTLTVDEESGYVVLAGSGVDNVSLGLYSEMSGKAYIGPSGTTISIGYFNVLGIAEGTLFEQEAVLVYQSQNQIAVYVNETLAYYLVLVDDNNVAIFDTNRELLTVFVLPDSLLGKYVNGNKSFEFDGRSLVEGYYAAVTYINGEEVNYCYYTINQDGTVTVFSIDRSGETDVEVPLFTVYTSEQAGAVEYVGESGSVWVAAVNN